MNFFKAIAKRTQKEPSRAVEADLFRKIDAAFARDFRPAPSRVSEFSFGALFRFAPLALAAGLVLAFGVELDRTNAPNPSSTNFAVGSVGSVDSEIFSEGADYEFYDEMEDWMLTASDDDWNHLLEGKS